MLTIANNIRKIRKEKGLTQVQVSKATGFTQSRVAEYETERYKPENITLGAAINLANALGCTLDELFTSEEQTE